MIREFEWKFKSLKLPAHVILLGEQAITRLEEKTGERYCWVNMMWGRKLVFESNGVVLFPVSRRGKNPKTRKFVIVGIDFDKQPEEFFFLRLENDDFDRCAIRLGLVTASQKMRLRKLIEPKAEPTDKIPNC